MEQVGSYHKVSGRNYPYSSVSVSQKPMSLGALTPVLVASCWSAGLAEETQLWLQSLRCSSGSAAEAVSRRYEN